MRTTNIIFTVGFVLFTLSASVPAVETNISDSNLLDLARKEFGVLSKADIRLFEAVSQGKIADYSAKRMEENDPNQAAEWGEERVIKANRIIWLCNDLAASKFVSLKGISILFARIDGELDLSFACVSFPLLFCKCNFSEDINLLNAKIIGLCLDGSHTKNIKAQGLEVQNDIFLRQRFKSRGEVNLSNSKIGGNLICDNSEFNNEGKFTIVLDDSEINGNIFMCNGFKAKGEVRLLQALVGGSFFCKKATFISSKKGGRALSADGIEVGKVMFMTKDFKAEGEVNLNGAKIGGQLACDGGEFINPEGRAISAQSIEVKNASFRNSHVVGTVDLLSAEIKGELNCIGGRFFNPKLRAIDAKGIEVSRTIYLIRGFKAEGEVNLNGARIGENFVCDNGEFKNEGRRSLILDGSEVKGNIFIRDGFKAQGEVRAMNVSIGGTLECDNAEFKNERGHALVLDGSEVKGNIFIRDGFKAQGEVRAIGVSIGGTLECYNAEFRNEMGPSLNADGIQVKGDIRLKEGFKSIGEVRLLNAVIGGNLDCEKATIISSKKGGRALSADGIKVGQVISISMGFKAEGEVTLGSAKIGDQLQCSGGEFINPGHTAINAQSIEVKGPAFFGNIRAFGKVDLLCAKIEGLFIWKNVPSPNEVTLDLTAARIGILLDEEKSWPKEGNLYLQNLIYDGINDKAPSDAESRIRWLRLQPEDSYRPQPYEQLAEVFKKEGREDDAKEVLIAKNEDCISMGKLKWYELLRYRLLKLIDYGYRPFKITKYIIVFIILGCVTFKFGYKWGLIEPLRDRVYNYPKFNCFIYSLDMFIPLINLYQKDYWSPFSNKRLGSGRKISWKCYFQVYFWIHTIFRKKSLKRCFYYYLLVYSWIHIFSGWILTTLFLCGLTGLVRT